MKKSDLVSFRIKKLVKEEEKYEFPDMLRMLRSIHGMKRKNVAIDLGLSQSRIFYLEYGGFKRFPSEEITLLSDYYGVAPQLLRKKAKKFLSEAHNKDRSWKRLDHVNEPDVVRDQEQELLRR